MMKVRGGSRITAVLLEIQAYFDNHELPETANRKIARIVAVIGDLATHHNTRRTANDLPPNYRRALAEDYIVYYVVKPEYVLAYDVRYAGRKSLKSSTHRRRATQAERESFELN